MLDWTTWFARRIDPERSWGGSERDFYGPEEDLLWADPNRRHPRPDGSGIVVAEIISQLHEVPSVGPGGRIRALRQTRGLLIEATVRRCERPVGGEWRSIGPIVDSIREASADVEPMTIRFTFGYHEASKFETQQWLRPVFVFLLEQPDLQAGPRWRIALVQAATEGDDLPPDAGLEGVLGHCG